MANYLYHLVNAYHFLWAGFLQLLILMQEDLKILIQLQSIIMRVSEDETWTLRLVILTATYNCHWRINKESELKLCIITG
jgi:hypothetical protein